MTWLGYKIILTDAQFTWAVFVAIFFYIFGMACGRPPKMCLMVMLAAFPLACIYAVNDNAMFQIKAEFCAKHPEIDRCIAFR